jgi:hypothetical protein
LMECIFWGLRVECQICAFTFSNKNSISSKVSNYIHSHETNNSVGERMICGRRVLIFDYLELKIWGPCCTWEKNRFMGMDITANYNYIWACMQVIQVSIEFGMFSSPMDGSSWKTMKNWLLEGHDSRCGGQWFSLRLILF